VRKCRLRHIPGVGIVWDSGLGSVTARDSYALLPTKNSLGVAIGLGVPYVYEGFFSGMFNQLLRSCITFCFVVIIYLLLASDSSTYIK
jgi:hypothetical protein